MRLRVIEIQGFKSFPDRTKLIFDRDVTAVIGPNGSGKSNISDAVRWVLGEQSNKQLRGKSMEDVIFSGTALRKALGFAEVSITFDNDDRQLHFDADEVTVARRYFRSGESEYKINGAAVRLKDVHELFMDTGLGRDGYSMIGQGKIDEIVSSKSDERRDIFEEAAGISKYRYRRQEAKRRLDRAQDNLVRLNDIMGELKSRVEPLKEQSEKAQRFLEVSGEKKQLEIGLWLKTLNRSNGRLREQDNKITLAKSQYEQLERELTQLVVASEESALQSQKITAQIDAIRRQGAQLEEKASSARGEIAVLENTLFHNNETIARLRQDIEAANTDDETIEQETARLTGENERLTLLKQAKENELNSLVETLSSLTGDTGDYSRQINDKNLKLNELSARIAENKVTVFSADNSVKEITESIDETDAGIEQLGNSAKEALTELEAIKRDLDECERSITECENIVGGHQMKLNARQQKLDEKKEQADQIALDIGETERRIKIITEMERNMDGFNYAVKSVTREAANGALRGIRGPVSRLIGVDGKYATAIETALGAAAQNIIVSTEEDAKRAITYLKNNNGGRATFLPLTSISGKTLNEKGVSDCLGFVGIASQLISFDAEYREIINSLLGRTVVSEDMDSAVATARKYGYKFKVVTLDGQVVNAGGSLTGGSGVKNSGLLNRTGQIKDLQAKLKKQNDELERCNAEYRGLVEETARIKAEYTAADSELKTANEDKIRLLGELKLCEEQEKSAGLQLKAFEERRDGFVKRIEMYKKRAADAQAELAADESARQTLESEIDALSGGRDMLGEKRARLADAVSAVKLEIIGYDKDIENNENTVRQLESAKTGRAERIAALSDEIEQINKSNEETQHQIEQLNRMSTGLMEQNVVSAQELEQLDKRRNELDREGFASRTLEREKSQDKEKLSGELARLTERREVMEKEYADITAKLFEEYELTKAQAEEIGFELEDEKTASKRLNEIKRIIRSLGAVNVAAIEEYKEVSQRYEFIKAQLDDIEASRRELNKLIAELTAKMREMFISRFEIIGENFTEIFKELFGGGTARLKLTDADNVLESGIEIYAQPPGKNISIIEQLSGGEKALIALSIYFAIMKVNAPPFCLLDEVETALDEVNVDKVAQYLRKMSGNTQIITITHRRGTMEEADVLYGVTMQEKGVSKLLSIDVSEIEKTLEAKVNKNS